MRRLLRILSQRIREKLREVVLDPFAQHNNVTRLVNRPGYRLRVGDWRIIYDIQDERMEIMVMRVAPRGEAYS